MSLFVSRVGARLGVWNDRHLSARHAIGRVAPLALDRRILFVALGLMSAHWYRGVVQYDGGSPSGFVVHTPKTAALEFVWIGSEHMRDDLDADGYWVERCPVDCWERVDDASLLESGIELSERPSRGQSETS